MWQMQERMCYRRFPEPFFNSIINWATLFFMCPVESGKFIWCTSRRNLREWKNEGNKYTQMLVPYLSCWQALSSKSVVGGWQLRKSCKAANQETRLWHYHTPSPPLHPSFSPLITLSSDKAMALGSSKVLETKSNIWQLPSPSSAKVRLTSSIWAHTQCA